MRYAIFPVAASLLISPPERFREIVRAEVAKWAEVIEEIGLHID